VLRSDEIRRLEAERLQLAQDLEDARRRVAGADGAAEPGEAQARMNRLESEVAAARALAEEALARHEALALGAHADVAQARSIAGSRSARVKSLAELTRKNEALASEGVVSEREVLQQREQLEDASAELDEARRAVARSQADEARAASDRLVDRATQAAALARLEGELAEARAGYDKDTMRARTLVTAGGERLAALDRALATASGDLITVTAPYGGSVVALWIERPGVSVERGAQLAAVAPQGTHLFAAIEIPEGEAATVAVGSPVRLLFDAYPYTRHGVVRAQLTWVSPAAVAGVVPAIATLDRETITIDGRDRALPVGSAGRARIDAGRETVLHYVLEPLSRLSQAAGGDGPNEPPRRRRAPPPAAPGPSTDPVQPP
jgi:multidrug resistance efflux pump